MKKYNNNIPAAAKLNLLRQICNFIPDFLAPKLARATGAQDKARTFSPWSHLVALMYAQLTHSIGLNDVCDALGLHSGPLSSIRGATPPNRNTLSHANKVRPAAMAEQLFWAVLEHLGNLSPGFVSGKAGKRFARKFKRAIHLVDSTTIPLIASCLDWAKHRRRKAAAKCHLRLDLQSFLLRFAIVDTARHNDARRARELCAGVKAGEIVIFDKAYVDFAHLADLSLREVFWVTRAKENLSFSVVKCFQHGAAGKILRDDLIELQTPVSRDAYPVELRRIVALVEVDGREVEMVFLTNNLEWSARSIVELYRCRWQIEVFFKQIKQTLQLADFLGTTANAVRWQVWTALLVYLLLRYLAFLSDWSHSFSRLFTLIRAALWKKWDVLSLLRGYGTAGGHFRYLAQPEQAYLPGWG
ncbi:MAG TPA: IS4 family transposase [Candidatus Angelobacter sp.]|nr:IS4 family transposase [Candidatus Angelobacter sp.]